MKNKRAIWMMTVAVLLGVGAVMVASRWLLKQPGAKTTQIVLAATDVSLGQRLSPDMMKMTDWPAGSAPPGSFHDQARLTGRVLKTSVLRGEPLTEAKLAPVGTIGGLSALITEGRRAITVRVNDVVGVAGFALPGNYVDIIVHTERETHGSERKAQDISKIVLERILVLAVAQEVDRDETKPKVVNAVTLEVTPEQAEALDLARSVGTLSLVLRNQIDPRPSGTDGATKKTLLAEADPPPPPPAAPPPARVHKVVAPAPAPRNCVGVISGTRTTKECFQ
ncbi:Flp pilus assembly protein CpaB [Pseudoduganella sp. GCM10020061]|uniref:Flp pilus assembly protein CpaB n=1 Tax=Pseudoduganella sp. GCM10020061 TaxID=3317345 RepID=UPI0036408437